MADIYPHHCSGAAGYGMADHVPFYAGCNTCYSAYGVQANTFPVHAKYQVDVAELKSRISSLEHELAQCQKDLASAQSVIACFVANNTPRSPQNRACSTCQPMLGMIKDVVDRLITTSPDRSIKDKTSSTCSGEEQSAACEDLLDLHEVRLSHEVIQLSGPEDDPPLPVLEQEEGTQLGIDMPLLPYVKRFSRAIHPLDTACTTSSIHFSKDRRDSDVYQDPRTSAINLDGETQYGRSQRTSSPSTSSSLQNFDNELEESVSHSETVGTSVSSFTQHPVLRGNAAAFLPKWPTNPSRLSSREFEGAVFVHKRLAGNQEHRYPDLFKYGIRFDPELTESNLYRSVLIDNLPFVQLCEILLNIKGGVVVDAKLFDTTKVTGGMSAMITFLYEHGARALEKRASQQALTFDGIRARVTLLPTPTYPLSANLQTAITKYGQTRCLEIRNFPKDIKPAELEYDMRVCTEMTTHRIVSKKIRSDGILELHFTSIRYAGQAYGALTTWRRYRQCKVSFAPDPCTLSREEASSAEQENVETMPDSQTSTSGSVYKDPNPSHHQMLGSEQTSPKEKQPCNPQ
ncbi:MAG: hypothetical protein Q9219_005102 [cf. Caloplaca sp. 3 TL-2023]